MKISVLGTGVTGQAVMGYCKRHGLELVSPEGADWVVASPGIPPSQFPNLPTIISEIDFAWLMREASGRHWYPIAVTGTNGKSTVTAMISHLLSCPIGGNFGVPLIEFVDHESDCIAVELSSYQLEITRFFQPMVSVWTNLTPDHLERHHTMVDYASAKANLLRCAPHVPLIYGDGYPDMYPFIESHLGPTIAVSESHDLVNDIATQAASAQADGLGKGLIGTHNHINAAMAILAVSQLHSHTLNGAIQDMMHYHALPHRMEWVASTRGVAIYNDSKSTNPDSTLVALHSFSGRVILLLGGKDKGLPLDEFILILLRASCICVCYGEIAPRIRSLVPPSHPSFVFFDTLPQSVDYALDIATHGDTVLLSPACSSFDQFKDFIDRGDQFKAYVRSKI